MNAEPGIDTMTDHAAARPNFVNHRKLRNGFSFVELLVVIMIIAALVALMLPAVRRTGSGGVRAQCKNNLKQIALALHNYEEVYGAFPPAYTVDADGKRLHSWRTLILPYLERRALYDRIDLSKPWDDPANAVAFQTIIHTYRCPSAAHQENYTTYLAVVASNGCIHPTRGRRLDEITDGTSRTLMVIEVDSREAVHWMSPMDADENLVLRLGSETELPHENGMHAAFADGSAQFLSADMPAAECRALISIAGNDN